MSASINSNNPVLAYKSVLTKDDITSISEERPASNAWSPDTSTAWEGLGYSGVSTTYQVAIELENTSLINVDYIALAKTNLNSQGYTYSVDGWEDDVGWSPIIFPTTPVNDQAILITFNTIAYESYRIVFEAVGVTDVDGPIIGHIKMGNKTVLQRREYSGYSPPISNKVIRSGLVSENGNYLGQIVKSKFQKGRINQPDNEPGFVRTEIKTFNDHINGTPVNTDSSADTFFYSWRPGDYPDEVLYCWPQGGINYTNQSGDSVGGMVEWSLDFMAFRNG